MGNEQRNEQEKKTGSRAGGAVSREMRAMADRFLDGARAFFTGKMTEKELTDITTQPFWESLCLSKKRLDEKGIVMDLTIVDDKKKNRIHDGDVAPVKSEYLLVGSSVRDVWTERRFYKDGRQIYRRGEQEIASVGLLKSRVDGEIALCPNCGHEDKISSYIDGCDYCGSKFLVSDFDVKVSAFSLQENIQKKLGRTIKRSFLLLFGITAAAILLFLVALGVLFLLLRSGNNGISAIYSVMVMMFMMEVLPIASGSVVPFAIVSLIASAGLQAVFGKSILKPEVAQEVIPDFSPEEFWQNLDYQLKSVILAGNGQAAAAFSSCPLADVTAGYQNVVDCMLTKITFLQAEKRSDGYALKVQAVVKLVRLNKKHIKTKYERLTLDLFAGEEAVGKSFAAIREFKCPHCGSSINILQGGVCEYCQTQLDYSKFGWVISSYERVSRFANLYRRIQVGMIGLYALVLAITAIRCNASIEGDNWYDIYRDVQGMYQILEQLYDDIILPDALDGVEEIDHVKKKMQRTYTYRSADPAKTMEDYKELLKREPDYLPVNESPGRMVFYKEVVAAGEEGYLQIAVTEKDGELRVELTVVDDTK